MYRNFSQPIPQTQKEALNDLTVDTLKTIAKSLRLSGNIHGRKHELIEALIRYSSDDNVIISLSDIGKKVLAETAYLMGGIFDKTRVMAKYKHSLFSNENDCSLPILDLFIINRVMPKDISERIKRILPKPEASTINCFELLPHSIVQSEKHYDGDHKITVNIQERKTEQNALQNFEIVLRLIESGKIKISSSSRCPTGAAMILLAGYLIDADWYEQPCYGGIQAFAWPLLMQVAGFAAASANSLSITSKGKNVLLGKIPVHEAMKAAWESWKSKAIIDEFNRIDVIKGQKAKGRVMTSAPQRRSKIIQALSECPKGKWVSVEELGRYMRAENKSFEVTHNPWMLYICERQYGALGYDDYGNWEILQERYIKVLLLEYAATLGIIDVGYALPEEVARNYNHMWGTDDLEFLSRYDGLLFFRINDLGAYILSNEAAFTPAVPKIKQTFDVLPNFDIVVSDIAGFSKTDNLFLDKIAKRESDFLWKITPVSIKNAFEKGENSETILSFLKIRAKNGIPQNVEILLQDASAKVARFSYEGRACLLECKDPDILQLVSYDSRLKQYAIAVESSFVIIKPGKENDFFRRMRELGYSVPVSEKI